MNRNESKAVALNRDDALIITECGRMEGASPDAPYAKPVPRVVITTNQYNDESAVFPAQSVTLYGDPVRKLYNALKEYFDEADQAK